MENNTEKERIQFIQEIAKSKIPNATYHKTFIEVFGHFRDADIKIDKTQGTHLTQIYKYFEKECPELQTISGKGKKEVLRKYLQDLFNNTKTDIEMSDRHSPQTIQIITEALQEIQSPNFNFLGRDEAITTENSPKLYIDKQESIQSKIDRILKDNANVSSSELYGVENYLEELSTYLSENTTNLISVVGSGGVGKTSIADKLVRKYAADNSFINLAWVTAKQRQYHIAERRTYSISNSTESNHISLIIEIAKQLGTDLPPNINEYIPILKRNLSIGKQLIIIDNLETLQDYKSLLKIFDPCQSQNNIAPSKIIFTSREKLESKIFNVREVKIEGISLEATIDLIRNTGKHIAQIRNATNDELKPIYEFTGGVPLIILLVVNKIAIDTSSLNDIFRFLYKEEDLIDFLYDELLNSISSNSLKLLMCMCFLASGSKVSYQKLHNMTELSEDDFRNAIKECTEKFLLTPIQKTINDSSDYSIHSLLHSYISNGWL
jgi:hypothetical protein